jgi:hypothetical protein
MSEANSRGPQFGPKAWADEAPPFGVPAQPAKSLQEEPGPATPGAGAADAAPSKEKSVFTFPAFVAAAAVIYFLVKLASGASLNVWDWLFTFGGLGLGAWVILLNVAVVAGYVVFRLLGWVFFASLALAVFNPTWDTLFSPMTTPVDVYFTTLSATSSQSVCTTSPAGWVFHVFHPSACAGTALSRLGVVVLGTVILWVMISIWRWYGFSKWQRKHQLARSQREEEIKPPLTPPIVVTAPASGKATGTVIRSQPKSGQAQGPGKRPAPTTRPQPGPAKQSAAAAKGTASAPAKTDAAALGRPPPTASGSGSGGMLRRLGRGPSEPESPEPEPPAVTFVRQQRTRQSRSKRTGKR